MIRRFFCPRIEILRRLFQMLAALDTLVADVAALQTSVSSLIAIQTAPADDLTAVTASVVALKGQVDAAVTAATPAPAAS